MRRVIFNDKVLGEAATWTDAIRLLNQGRGVPGSYCLKEPAAPLYFTRTADGMYWGADTRNPVFYVFVARMQPVGMRDLEVSIETVQPSRFDNPELLLVNPGIELHAIADPVQFGELPDPAFRPAWLVRVRDANGAVRDVRYVSNPRRVTDLARAQQGSAELRDRLVSGILDVLRNEGYAPQLPQRMTKEG